MACPSVNSIRSSWQTVMTVMAKQAVKCKANVELCTVQIPTITCLSSFTCRLAIEPVVVVVVVVRLTRV